MGKQKFLQYKTLVFFYENKCFPCVKLLFYTIKNPKDKAIFCQEQLY